MQNYSRLAGETLHTIRETKPLVHNITNYVVMNFTANILLAAGASPVMAHAENEVEQMVGFAGALVLNIGTLEDAWIASMLKAGKRASELGTPVILDPVGSGATPLRTEAAHRILGETRVRVVRGNASEVLSLGVEHTRTRGVDSLHSVDEAAAVALELARELDTTLAITGPVDLVTDGATTLWVENGHAMMPRVTGTGCAATAIIGAFCSVHDDPVVATAMALAYYGLAGERAGAACHGPGTFVPALIDALYTLSPEELARECRIVQG